MKANFVVVVQIPNLIPFPLFLLQMFNRRLHRLPTGAMDQASSLLRRASRAHAHPGKCTNQNFQFKFKHTNQLD